MMMTAGEINRTFPWKRTIKWLGISGAGLIGLVLILILLLLLSPVRNALLSLALNRIDDSLPGELVIEEAEWSSLGTIEFSNVTWVDGTELLFSTDYFSVSADLFAFIKGDVKLHDVSALAITADIAHISSRFARRDSFSSSAQQSTDDRGGFPREGSVPNLPSVQVDRLLLSARSIRLNDKHHYKNITLAGSIDLLHGHAPTLKLDTLTAAEYNGRWDVEELTMRIDLHQGSISARGKGSVQHSQSWYLEITPNGVDRFTILLTDTKGHYPPEMPGVLFHGELTRRQWRLESLIFDAVIRSPGTEDLSRIPAVSQRLESIPALNGIGMDLRGSVELEPKLAVRASCTIHQNDWFDGGQIALTYDGGVLEVEASGRKELYAIDRLHFYTDLSSGDTPPMVIALNARAKGFFTAVQADIQRTEGILVHLAPVVVHSSPRAFPPVSVVRSPHGTLQYDPITKNLIVENVRITGDLGRIKIDAAIDSTRSGSFGFECGWPQPPPILVRALDISSERFDSLRADWKPDAPYRLNASGKWANGGTLRAALSGTFSLPGPAALSILLPDSADVTAMGPIRGTFAAAGVSTRKGMKYNASMRIRENSWIDTSIVRIEGLDRNVTLDTLGIAVEGINIGMSGTVIDSLYNLHSTMAVTDAAFLRRFVSGIPDLSLRGGLTISGTSSAPRLEALFNAAITGASYELPGITSRIHFADNKISAFFDAPQGATTSHVQFSRLTASFVSLPEGNQPLPARLTLRASGEQFDFLHSLRVDTVDGLTTDVDTLNIMIGRQDLHLQQPFRIRILPQNGGLSIDDASLVGSMGTVSITGHLRPDRSRLTAAAKMIVPPKSSAIRVPEYLWPESIELDLTATGKSDVSVNARVSGFSLVTRRRPVLDLRFDSDSTLCNLRFSIADSSGTVFSGHGTVPASLVIYPPSLSFNDEALSLGAKLNRFPIAVRLIGGASHIPEEEIIQIDGDISMGGSAKSVLGDIRLKMDFSDWPKLSNYHLDVGASLEAASTTEPFTREDYVLSGTLTLERQGREMMTAEVRSPLAISLKPPAVIIDDAESINIDVVSDSIPLEDFDPLLPVEVGLGGQLSFMLTGKGPIHNPDLTGTITSRGFELNAADQARMTGDIDIRIEGTRQKPEINGEIRIAQAFIRIPDKSTDLHPTEGEAFLLIKDSSGAATDTISLGPDIPSVPPQQTAAPTDVNLDVNVIIPSGFWIRGKGLDLELSGALNIKQLEGNPTVTGELRVIRGSLIALGRRLELERGVVTFYGGDQIDPSLDVVLSADIEGTKVQIVFGGTTQAPEISFASQPDMPEADIISVLLFGRPYSQLDDGQVNLMRDRTREMLVFVGASQLQSKVGGQLGIDMLAVKSTGSDNTGKALSVGKYLNPQVLLSYAYALDKDSDSFVSLEYFLKGQFKVETIFGNQGQTSIGIGWSLEY